MAADPVDVFVALLNVSRHKNILIAPFVARKLKLGIRRMSQSVNQSRFLAWLK